MLRFISLSSFFCLLYFLFHIFEKRSFDTDFTSLMGVKEVWLWRGAKGTSLFSFVLLLDYSMKTSKYAAFQSSFGTTSKITKSETDGFGKWFVIIGKTEETLDMWINMKRVSFYNSFSTKISCGSLLHARQRCTACRHLPTYWGFQARIVYLHCISCLRYTILVRNPWIIRIRASLELKLALFTNLTQKKHRSKVWWYICLIQKIREIQHPVATWRLFLPVVWVGWTIWNISYFTAKGVSAHTCVKK